jgi:hypothetical protein|tara:strand:+ start:165 stop:362 length:198 start_codon:yes stop_codon:yes gene_type:complete
METHTRVNTKIRVQIRNVFGNDLIYPMCINSKRFTDLTSSKTLSRNNIKIIKELGFEVDVVAQEI